MDFTNLSNFLDYMVDTNFTTGCSVVVYKDGKKVLRHSAGYSSIEEKTPMTGDELVYIYSCSKNVTVTAGLQLVERGILRMNEPVSTYIPELEHMKIKKADGTIVDANKPILVRHLFNMTAGFSYDFTQPGFVKARELTNGKMTTETVMHCLGDNYLSFEPGEKWQYSICHDVLAGLVGIVTGMPFSEYVKKNIFEPLGMKDSYYHPEGIEDRMAEQYFYEVDGSANADIVELQKKANISNGKGYFRNCGKRNGHILGPEYDSGGAGIITSVDDYAIFVAALANWGTGLNGARILAPSSIEMLRTNTLTEEQLKRDFIWDALKGCGYGYGVRTHMYPGVSGVTSNIGEFGWGGAAGATTIIDPKENLAVFFVQHNLNPREEWYQPRLRTVVYSCL